VQLVGLPVCLSPTDVRLVLNQAFHWNTWVQPKIWLMNHWEGLHSTFPKIDTKSDAHLLFLFLIHSENCHRSHTRLQIHSVKTAHVHPTTCKFAHWLTRHGSPIYWCFALPQLLYRWRHQSPVFCIQPHMIRSAFL
jgi:hypothetical protein